MPVLDPSEYDISYFDGQLTALQHNAGYGRYTRWFRSDPGRYPEDTGERFSDIAAMLHGRFNMNNKSVLILGCAKGFLVKSLRDLGIDAWGIDVSPYAIGEAETEVQSYLAVGDARELFSSTGINPFTGQKFKRNEYNVIFSRWFLCCFTDAELAAMINEWNTISQSQVHILMPVVNPDFYTVHTAQEWLDLFDWAVGTILVPDNNHNGYLTKIN